MDAKYLAEIKKDANRLVKLADNPYCQGPVSLLDGVKRVVPALLTEVERMNCELSRIRSNAADDKKMLQKDNAAKDRQNATLKKEIEQLAEERDAAKRKKDELEAFYEQLCQNIAQEASK